MRCHRPGVAALALAAVVTLAGCTGDTDPPPGPQSPTGAAPSPAPTTTVPEGDVTTEGLSDALFEAAAEDVTPLASAAGPVPGGSPTTVDVLEVRPSEDGTYVRLRLTAEDVYAVGLTVLADERFGSSSFVRDVHLDDRATGTRLLPLQFTDYREACVCPYKPLELGPGPVELTAVFPALPEGTERVDVGLGGDEPLTVVDVPVG